MGCLMYLDLAGSAAEASSSNNQYGERSEAAARVEIASAHAPLDTNRQCQ